MPEDGRFRGQTFLEFAELLDTCGLRLPLLVSDILSVVPVLITHAHVGEDFGPEPSLELDETDLRISRLEELIGTKAVCSSQNQPNLRDADGENLTCWRILLSAGLFDDLDQVMRDPTELPPAYAITLVGVVYVKQGVEDVLQLPVSCGNRYLDLQESGDRQKVVELKGPFPCLNGLVPGLAGVDREHRGGLKQNQVEFVLLNGQELFYLIPPFTQISAEFFVFRSCKL